MASGLLVISTKASRSRLSAFLSSVFFRQQRRRGGAFALVIGGLGDDPDFDFCRKNVGRQNSGAIMQGFVVESFVFVGQIAPVFADVTLNQIDDIDIRFLQSLQCRWCRQQFADRKIWFADLNYGMF